MTDADSRMPAQDEMLLPLAAGGEANAPSFAAEELECLPENVGLRHSSTTIPVEAANTLDRRAMQWLGIVAVIGLALGVFARIWSTRRG